MRSGVFAVTFNVVAICIVALTGCSRDKEVLDRFSHDYTAFLNAEGDTFVSSVVVIYDDEKPGTYWTELGGAMDMHVSNQVRLGHAHNALLAENDSINKKFDEFNSKLDDLDQAVRQLIETGNTIGDRVNRENAIRISQFAREVQSSFALLRTLDSEAYEGRRHTLMGIIADGGAVLPSSGLKEDALRIEAIAEEQKTADQRVETGMQQLGDAFGALAGKTGLKKYPAKSQ